MREQQRSFFLQEFCLTFQIFPTSSFLFFLVLYVHHIYIWINQLESIENMKKHMKFALLPFYFLIIMILFFVILISPRNQTAAAENNNANNIHYINVGVIVDYGRLVGKMVLNCINMTLSDFYISHGYYKTRLRLHIKDSKEDVVEAAAASTYFCHRSLIEKRQ